ncbi:hypothetical protein BVZ31_03200 [Alcaligenes faecalis]|nr:hypothetical protein BVZ30_13475 [Alcaligenes faecalis]OSZ52369.1 hypothetical protein BVZ31_03200 [Alcaligenes faecalis]OSZ54340.1 hypothetical protein BVZ32_03635 [Alcaligenes faecalis]
MLAFLLPAVLIFNLARSAAHNQGTQTSHQHRGNNPSHNTHPNHHRRHRALYRAGRARKPTALAQTRNSRFKSN